MTGTASRPRRQQARRGTAATELAIALPLLVTLCLTSVDLGRFGYAYIALANASRVGAEYGATRQYPAASDTAWKQRLVAAMQEDLATNSGLDPAELQTEVNVASDAYDLDRVTITATFPYRTVVAWPGIPQELEMKSVAVFRRFR